MAHQLVLGSLLGASQPYDLGAQYSPPTAPEQTYTLTDDEYAEVNTRMSTANRVFRYGVIGSVVGGGVTATGFVIAIVGIIPALGGSEGILIAGVVTMVAGVGIATVALPVMVTGALMGNAVMRRAGMEVSSVPGYIALGGVGVFLGSAVWGGGGLTNLGLGAIIGGSIWQYIISNNAFKAYKEQNNVSSDARLSVHPVAALDGYGLGLTVSF